MSSLKPVSKGVLVSFNSDSEDEGNTSSSSARGSSRDDGLSSEDETSGRLGRKGKAAATAGGKEKGDKTKEKKSEFDDLPMLTTNRSKNGQSDIKAEDAGSASVDCAGVTSATKSKKISKISDVDNDIKTKPAKDADITNDTASKTKKKTFTEDQTVIKAEVIDPEERNLAPPSKNKIKTRSKSPKDETMESNVNIVEEERKKKSSLDAASSLDERNLSPIQSKRRDKSPKETEKQEENVTKAELISDPVQDESSEKPTKIKKKKKQTSEEREELDVEKSPDINLNDVTVKKKKAKDVEELCQATTETLTSPNDEVVSGKVHKKKSSKIEELPAAVNGERDLEIPQSVIAPESPSLRRKKKKEVIDDASKPELDVSDKRTSAELTSTPTSELIGEEKPKKKKSSKTAAADLDSTKSVEDSVAVRVIGKDLNAQDSEISKKSEKPLEAAVQEKVDAVIVSEVQDLPSNDVKIVKPVSEELVSAKPLSNTPDTASLITDSSNKTVLEAGFSTGRSVSEILAATEEAEEEERKARKKASEALNQEVARYLESLPTYTRSVEAGAETDAKEPPAEIKEPLVKPPVADPGLVEDENSEFTQRRQSMDDFIKKILAEAREERQRLKGNLETDATLLGKVAAGESLLPAGGGETKEPGDKEASMLERRLASVEKKRLKESDDGKTGLGKLGSKSKGMDEEEDEITKILNARRAQRKAIEEGMDFDDAESLPSEAGSMRHARGRRARDEYDDDESIASSKPPLMPGRIRGARGAQDAGEGGEKSESFVAKWRREREASQLPEDSFAPRRSDQTDEVIRERTRHIRIIVEQQADIAKTMRATSRSMDELDNEIREVRQMALDWQARIEALESGIDSEYRQYEQDQQAANERLRQQRVPDDRALREELRNVGRGARRTRGESVEDEGFVPGGPRRRSGSVASTTSVASSYMGGRGGGMDSGLELDYYLGGGSKRSDARRAESETDYSMDRLRRGGSLSRNLSDILGDSDDTLGIRSRGGSGRLGPEPSPAPSVSDEVMRIRAKYSTLSSGPSTSYNPSSSRLSAGADAGGYSSLTAGYRRDSAGLSSRYGDSSASLLSGGRYSSGLSSGGDYTSLSSLPESSRIRRAMSVSDMNYDRTPSYRGSTLTAGYGDPGTSKFLGGRTTRDSKPNDYSSLSSLTTPRSKDKPFKSRFLKSSSGLSEGSRFTSGGGEGGSAPSGSQGAE